MAIKPVSNTQNVPIDFFGVLPEDVLSEIFSRVIQSKDIHSLMLTDRRVNELILKEGEHWKSLLESHFPCDFKKNPNPPHPKDHYKRLKIRDKNCRENKCLRRRLIGHQSDVKKFAFHEGMLISGDNEGFIKVWDSKSGKGLFTLAGHQGAVDGFAFYERMLISHDERNKLKFWDLKNGEETGQNKPYQEGRRFFLEMNNAIHEGKFFLTDVEQTLKIYDLETGEELNLLTDDDKKEVQWIAVYKGKLILSYDNGTIKVFDIERGEELYRLTGDAGWGLTVKGDYLIANFITGIKVWDLNLNGREALHKTGDQWRSVFSDVRDDLLIYKFTNGSIIVFDLKSGKELCTATISNDGIEIQEGMLILGPLEDGSFLVCDLKNKKDLNPLMLQERVYCFAVQGEILVSFGADNDDKYSLKVFDIRSGEELYTLAKFDGDRADLLAFHEGVLYANRGAEILAWDFNKSPEEFLEENLSLLKELKNAARNKFAVKAAKLCQKLDPRFQERLRQHAFNFGGLAISNVQTEVCLALLLESIRRRDQKRVSTSLQELLKIDSENIKLCDLLSEICGHPETKEWGVRAFCGEEGYPASLEQKAKAVLKFQRQFLLIDLGLVSDHDYLKKLQCSREDLEKVGILSREDLDELAMTSVPAIAHLEMTDAENQAQPGERQKKILDLLRDLSELVQDRDGHSFSIDGDLILRTHGCEPEGFLDEHCPWDLFARQFERKAALIEEKCQFTRQLSENYSEIIADVNALLDEFNVFDRQHQIAILYLYLDQEGLEERWKALNERGIYSLAEFLKLEDWNPFDMAAKERIPHPSDE